MGRKKDHGMYGTSFYRRWQAMKTRCENPKHIYFKRYGGRGITFDRKWGEFYGFMDDMFESYSRHKERWGDRNTKLDRRDNNGYYSKENCRWVTNRISSRNRADNTIISFNGKEMCLEAWSEHIGISSATLDARFKSGWSIEKSLSTPLLN